MNKENTAHVQENKIAKAIKRQWETLKDKQDGVETLAASERVKKVDIRKDNDGKAEIVVKTADGKELSGKNGKKVFTALSEKTERLNNDRLIDAFLERIKEEGFANVESQIPQYLREEILAACHRENISLSAKGEKAERREKEAERQERQREIAEAAERAANKAQEKAPALADTALAATLGRAIVAPPVVCHSPTGPGLIDVAFSIPGTQAVVDFEKRGGKIKMPPVYAIPKQSPEAIQAKKKFTEIFAAFAAECTKDRENIDKIQPKWGKFSVTFHRTDGTSVTRPPQNYDSEEFSRSLFKYFAEKRISFTDLELSTTEGNGVLKSLKKVMKQKGLNPDDPKSLTLIADDSEVNFPNVSRVFVEQHAKDKLDDFDKLKIKKKENDNTAQRLTEELQQYRKQHPPEPFVLADVFRKEELCVNAIKKAVQDSEKANSPKTNNENKALQQAAFMIAKTHGIKDEEIIPQELKNQAYNLAPYALKMGFLFHYKDNPERMKKEFEKICEIIKTGEKDGLPKKTILEQIGPTNSKKGKKSKEVQQNSAERSEAKKEGKTVGSSPVAPERRVMPEKLAAAARPEVLSPVNTDAGHVAAQLRKNAKKLTSPVRKKSLQETLGRKRSAPTKQEPAKKQPPQRTPADVSRIKEIQNRQQAHR